ncbi:MAG: hypothetical protein OSJ28_05870 [Desulfovibrio sp.]|nr:hypothetical protein [Desulfovibrio sp.]
MVYILANATDLGSVRDLQQKERPWHNGVEQKPPTPAPQNAAEKLSIFPSHFTFSKSAKKRGQPALGLPAARKDPKTAVRLGLLACIENCGGTGAYHKPHASGIGLHNRGRVGGEDKIEQQKIRG